MDSAQLKAEIISEIDSKADQLYSLSKQIHANPELGFKEFKACGWLSDFLEKAGFKVERGICQFPTAFRAVYGAGRPVIAFLAEYDALPEIGHACGHNLIACCSVGAALGAILGAREYGGTIQVIGTPAEELYAGKQVMAQRGAFADLDAAMMVHPGGQDLAKLEVLACQRLDIEFFGKAAHAAGEPQAGINALEALILSFNAIDALRQHLPPKGMVHGIITNGGTAANIVPDHSAANFIVRAGDLKTLEEVKEKVLNCFRGAATSSGARLSFKWEEDYYAPLLNNLAICRLYVSNMRRLGRKIRMEDPSEGFGSTDFGNVSQLLPGMHAQVGISKRKIAGHSLEFKQAAISETGLKAMLQAAQGLALTAVDLLASPNLMDKVNKEFSKGR